MDETCGTYVDDEYVDNHDYDDDNDDGTDDDTDDDADDDTDDDNDHKKDSYTAAGDPHTKTRRHQEVINGQDLSQTRVIAPMG